MCGGVRRWPAQVCCLLWDRYVTRTRLLMNGTNIQTTNICQIIQYDEYLFYLFDFAEYIYFVA